MSQNQEKVLPADPAAAAAGAAAVAEAKMSVPEAQDAMAASFPIFETLAWRFFAIARDLEAGEQNEEFPNEKPGPLHLRWFTANAALSVYYELLEVRERARKAAERNDFDLEEEWQDRQRHSGRFAQGELR